MLGLLVLGNLGLPPGLVSATCPTTLEPLGVDVIFESAGTGIPLSAATDLAPEPQA